MSAQQQLKAKMDALRHQVDEAEIKAAAALEKANAYQAELTTHESTIADLQRKLHLSEGNVERLESQNETIRTKLVAAEASLEESLHNSKSLGTRLSSLDDVDNLKNEIANLRKKLHEADQRAEEAGRKVHILQSQLDKAESGDAAGQIERHKKELHEAERKAEDLERRCQRLQGDLDKAESAVQTHREAASKNSDSSIAMEHLERKIRDLTLQLDKKDAEVQTITKQKEGLQTELDSLLQELN